jgi:hypothetical protein
METMAEDAEAGNVGAEDYEYDLAHEETGKPHAEAPAPVLPQPPGMHVADAGGDYGYDAAHDLA